jgi:hypothetical protein
MNRLPLVITALTVVLTSAATLTVTHTRAQDLQSDAPTLSSVQGTLDALYSVISGDAGTPRDWDAFRDLFADGAQLRAMRQNRDGEVSVHTMSVDEYIEGATGFFESSNFYESEITSTSESFGHITHVFSTYESKRNPDDAAPFARGINSIQLYTDGTRWFIVSILWDSETDTQPIPAQYLGK